MSKLILAIDTTSEFGSLALMENQRLIEEVSLHSPDGFAHVLFGEIERMLARHGITVNDLGGFAAAAGPGSFTGVRVGLTAAKGLADATGQRVVGVSNLKALAWFGTRPLRAPVIDARRGEVFGAVYDSALQLVEDEVVMPFPDWVKSLPADDLELIANGFSIQAGEIPVLLAAKDLARAVGSIAAAAFAAGETMDPAEIDANYVRRSDAEKLWKDPGAR